jgi:hypothetical protein
VPFAVGDAVGSPYRDLPVVADVPCDEIAFRRRVRLRASSGSLPLAILLTAVLALVLGPIAFLAVLVAPHWLVWPKPAVLVGASRASRASRVALKVARVASIGALASALASVAVSFVGQGNLSGALALVATAASAVLAVALALVPALWLRARDAGFDVLFGVALGTLLALSAFAAALQGDGGYESVLGGILLSGSLLLLMPAVAALVMRHRLGVHLMELYVRGEVRTEVRALVVLAAGAELHGPRGFISRFSFASEARAELARDDFRAWSPPVAEDPRAVVPALALHPSFRAELLPPRPETPG